MKVQWLGQAGLLFQTNHITIMVDPYLSDSAAKINPRSRRRVPVEERIFHIHPDILIFTHCHIDHYDPETAQRFLLSDKPITVLCPSSVWGNVRKFGGGHNYVECNAGTQWSAGDVCIRAIPAAHSDPSAIGVDIESEDLHYYVTGDTLYNRTVLQEAPQSPYALFLPINGVGNNMNMVDAAKFARAIQAQHVVPLHFGMLDDLDPSPFVCQNRILPEIYKEVVFK